MSAFKHQIGGSHYTSMAIQPAEYCFKNGIGKLEGDAIAYLSRWKMKNGLEDLRKAKHTIELLIELEVNSRNELVKTTLQGNDLSVNVEDDLQIGICESEDKIQYQWRRALDDEWKDYISADAPLCVDGFYIRIKPPVKQWGGESMGSLDGRNEPEYQPKFGPSLWEKFSAERGDDEESQL